MAVEIDRRQRFCRYGRSVRKALSAPVMLTAARCGHLWFLTCSACPHLPETRTESRVGAVDWAMGHRKGTHGGEALVGFAIDE